MNYRNTLLVALGAVALGACAHTPENDPPVSLPRVSFYPLQDQSADQLDRDRYDCHVWSVEQTGFDPSRRIASREARATVVPSPAPAPAAGSAGVIEASYNGPGYGRYEREAAEYRRAIAACLEGRGYTVR